MFRILLVDDEENIRAYAQAFIPWASFQCEIIGEAFNGQEALAFLSSHPADILLTDIQMPVMNGLELSRQVTAQYPGIKIVLYTAYDEFQYAREAIDIGISGYVLKSDEPETIAAFFRKLCRSIPAPPGEISLQSPETVSPLIREACSYIREHYAETISLNQLADKLNVHPVHLARCFQQQLNQTYLEILTAERINAAKKMLQHGDLRVYEISLAVGYKKPAYFSSLFQKQTGMTPHDYRLRYQEDLP